MTARSARNTSSGVSGASETGLSRSALSRSSGISGLGFRLGRRPATRIGTACRHPSRRVFAASRRRRDWRPLWLGRRSGSTSRGPASRLSSLRASRLSGWAMYSPSRTPDASATPMLAAVSMGRKPVDVSVGEQLGTARGRWRRRRLRRRWTGPPRPPAARDRWLCRPRVSCRPRRRPSGSVRRLTAGSTMTVTGGRQTRGVLARIVR